MPPYNTNYVHFNTEKPWFSRKWPNITWVTQYHVKQLVENYTYESKETSVSDCTIEGEARRQVSIIRERIQTHSRRGNAFPSLQIIHLNSNALKSNLAYRIHKSLTLPYLIRSIEIATLKSKQ